MPFQRTARNNGSTDTVIFSNKKFHLICGYELGKQLTTVVKHAVTKTHRHSW